MSSRGERCTCGQRFRPARGTRTHSQSSLAVYAIAAPRKLGMDERINDFKKICNVNALTHKIRQITKLNQTLFIYSFLSAKLQYKGLNNTMKIGLAY